MEWVKTSDRLPNNHERVFYMTADGYANVGTYHEWTDYKGEMHSQEFSRHYGDVSPDKLTDVKWWCRIVSPKDEEDQRYCRMIDEQMERHARHMARLHSPGLGSFGGYESGES